MLASPVFWWILAAVALFLNLYLIPNIIIGYVVFVMHLKRTKKTKWTRACSSDDPVHIEIYNEGVAWSEKNAGRMVPAEIVSQGLRLKGEFYDFGSPNTAVVIGGRTEGLRYCYYFAQPYAEYGYNILVVDMRAHGESDGKYNTVGFEEHKDLLAWAYYLQEHCHTERIVFHGICIGSAGILYALTSANCPDCVAGMVADGMFPTFGESFKNHMVELKKPMMTYPFVNGWMKILTGHSMNKGPIHVIDRLEKPILMLHSREDRYSLPEAAAELFDRCGSGQKRIVWFERGKHSRLRYVDPERYDGAVRDFLKSLDRPSERTLFSHAMDS